MRRLQSEILRDIPKKVHELIIRELILLADALIVHQEEL
jgi:hypothetical protein